MSLPVIGTIGDRLSLPAPTDGTGQQLTQPSANPGQVSSLLRNQYNDWLKMRTVLKGTESMREAGETFLPKHPREPKRNYDNRLRRAVLTNYVEDALLNIISRPFSRPVQLSEDAPPELLYWAQDIDMEGHSLHEFLRDLMYEGVTDGQAHILVDFHSHPDPVSRADEIAFGSRPLLVALIAPQLLAVYTEKRGGMRVVTHLRYQELELVPDGFGERWIKRIRCIEPHRVRVWENDVNSNLSWRQVEDRYYPLDFVPLYSFYAGKREKDFVIKPPFLSLTNKNIEHWQLTSSYQTALDRCNFAMLAVRPTENANSPVDNLVSGGEGDTDARFEVGPDTVLVGDWYYVEPSAAGLKETAARLETLQKEMQTMALDPLTSQSSGSTTATEATIDETKSQSGLVEWALNLSMVAERAIGVMMWWGGLATTKPVRVTVNTEFSLNLSAGDLGTLVTARATGDITRRTLWAEFQRRGTLGPKFDPDAEEAALEAEAPVFAGDEFDSGETTGRGDQTSGGSGASDAGDDSQDPKAFGSGSE